MSEILADEGNDSKRRLFLYKNGSSDAEYERAKEVLSREGINEVDYTEVDNADVFDSKPRYEQVVLGVETIIGTVAHQGLNSIEDAAEILGRQF